MEDIPEPRQLKIVIVEDNEPLADIYKTRLQLIGYKCFVANDGQIALETIERERPDLVLLDMMVPKIAGDEILRRMRGSEWGKDIRVFVISNLNEVDAPKGLRQYNIEGYVVKANLSNDQLDQLVDNILKPAGQTEDTSLEIQNTVAHTAQSQNLQPETQYFNQNNQEQTMPSAPPNQEPPDANYQ